jgi:hypothetical protein
MMDSSRHTAAIARRTETRNIEFKGPMSWTASTCDRFELLKDICALANSGGGQLIVGRNEPDYTTGTVSDDEAKSFDSTAVNTTIHKYLAPRIECTVAIYDVASDRVIVVDVPEFDTSPLIFQSTGNCSDPNHQGNPHFRSSEIYIRTKAHQSARVTDPDDMRDLLARAVRKSGQEIVDSVARLLNTPGSTEEPLPASPYDAELEREDRDFFKQIFYPWTALRGHFDLVVRPVIYAADRLDKGQLRQIIRETGVAYRARSNIADTMPQEGQEIENAEDGVRAKYQHPEWKRYEASTLSCSGTYRYVKGFEEDYIEGTLSDTDRQLWPASFTRRVTMLFLLARNAARKVVKDESEEIQVDVRIDGLLNRRVHTDFLDPMSDMVVAMHAHDGTKARFDYPLRTTLAEFEVSVVDLSRKLLLDIFWTFGLDGSFVSAVQRQLLGKSEPRALKG